MTQLASNELLSSALTAVGAIAEVLVPGDDGYAGTASALFADGTPDLVIRPHDAAGVAAALRYAAGTGLAVTVRSGGHSMAGLSTSTDGMIIDTRRISGVSRCALTAPPSHNRLVTVSAIATHSTPPTSRTRGSSARTGPPSTRPASTTCSWTRRHCLPAPC